MTATETMNTITWKLSRLDIIPTPELRLDYKLTLIENHIASHPELSEQLAELADSILSNPF